MEAQLEPAILNKQSFFQKKRVEKKVSFLDLFLANENSVRYFDRLRTCVRSMGNTTSEKSPHQKPPVGMGSQLQLAATHNYSNQHWVVIMGEGALLLPPESQR